MNILNLIVRQGMSLVLAGVAFGLAGAYAFARMMESLLFGISSMDTVTFIAIPLLLSAVALAASYIPARRAAQIDPMISLRCE
jgi:putative ABC transport system permease protein